MHVGSDQSNAVEEIKMTLVNPPILAIFDPALEIELHTDASCIGLGAILFQKIGDKKVVIGYYTRVNYR